MALFRKKVTYYKDGNILDAQYKEVTPDKNGIFTFDGPIPAEEMDVTVQADNDVFGVHLQKVVEKYKGNDKIQFLSLSIDANKQAWLNKLKKV